MLRIGNMKRGLFIAALILTGCGGSGTSATPEPTPTLDEDIASYVQTWGGSESQYRVILTAACPQLEVLFASSVAKMDAEQEDSPEWRAALGYSNAVNSRQLDLDC